MFRMLRYVYVYLIGYYTFIKSIFKEDYEVGRFLLTGDTETGLIPWQPSEKDSFPKRLLCTICVFRPSCKYFTGCGMKHNIEPKKLTECNKFGDRNIRIFSGGRRSGKTTFITQNWQQLNQDNLCGNYLVISKTWAKSGLLMGNFIDQEPWSEQRHHVLYQSQGCGSYEDVKANHGTYYTVFQQRMFIPELNKKVQWMNYINWVAEHHNIKAVFMDDAELCISKADLRGAILNIPCYFAFDDGSKPNVLIDLDNERE